MQQFLCFCFCVAAWLAGGIEGRAESYPRSTDLCIYEATPGGIAMAVRAARENVKVVLVNHTRHPGGALSNGLGVWDTLYEGHRAPIYNEVRTSIFDHYRKTYGLDSPQYRDALPGATGHSNGKIEPKVFERIVKELIASEANITFIGGFYPVSARSDSRRIRSVKFRSMTEDKTFDLKAHVFADCSYEGDLMPVAGVAFRLGRESRDEFDEPHAGRLFMRRGHQEQPAIASQRKRLNLRYFGATGDLLSGHSTGRGDHNVQAFNLRTILSRDPNNQRMPDRPADDDLECYASLEFGSRVKQIPNQKECWNRPQLIGTQTRYILGDWSVRQQVIDQHWEAMTGLLWHLQHSPSVPDSQQKLFRQFGIARDEFVDNDNRPYEIYVREGRRLAGRYVITEHDLSPAEGQLRTPVHGDSVAFTDWYMDSHACTDERVGDSMHEGKHILHSETRPGEIPFRALLAKEVDNLLVPVGVSSTHVAWGAVRLEPTWMHLGEVAGQATAIALEEGVDVANIRVSILQQALAEKGAGLCFLNDIDEGERSTLSAAANFFATKGFFAGYDVRPTAGCDESTCRVWLNALGEMLVGNHDASLTHQRVVRLGVSGRGILGHRLEMLARQRLPAGTGNHLAEVRDASPLSRGQVLCLLYKVNRNASGTLMRE